MLSMPRPTMDIMSKVTAATCFSNPGTGRQIVFQAHTREVTPAALKPGVSEQIQAWDPVVQQR